MKCQTVEIDDDDTLLENRDGSIIQLEPYSNDAQIHITQRNVESEDEGSQADSLDEQIGQAIPSLVNSILEMMLKQQLTILIIVILHAILNTIFTFLGVCFRQDTINKLQALLDSQERAEQLYWFLTVIDIVSCLIFYYLAISAYRTKSYLMYQLLLKWVYYCFFIQVFLAYINKLNILLVFLKILTYIYSKFVAQLIKGIVNLPRQRAD
ncbi:unnamed protein product [Paramecium octaurelia]|uniref:Uncharacterized protein n=1 Tax=Paramecium octaurelia TaxID=43137 RepID=A0A8S1X5D0_PAROT|nr:unnamed protein product [Paramecium octaurelia]